MKNLAEAEIYVDTRFSVESGSGGGNWFRLADYGSMAEFSTDCAGWFDGEESPEYAYTEWDNIPDCLIQKDWLCPNIFEIRDAIQAIGYDMTDALLSWCGVFGWDITTDDPYKLVTDFQNYSCVNTPCENDTEPEDYDPGTEEEYYTHIMTGAGYGMEIFDDNYN